MATADQWLESHAMPHEVRNRILAWFESAYFVRTHCVLSILSALQRPALVFCCLFLSRARV